MRKRKSSTLQIGYHKNLEKASRLLEACRMGAWATVGAEQIEESMRVVPRTEPVRTLEDMEPEEKRGIEKLYGVRLCETHWRSGRRR